METKAGHRPTTTPYSMKKVGLIGIIVLMIPFIGFICLDVLFPLPIKNDYSHLVLDAKGRVLHSFLSSDDKWRMQTELSEINPDIRTAFLAKEDQWFYWHAGVNPFAIVRAFINNVIAGRTTSGASTITMQVARLLEPKKRTLSSKIIEVFRAFQLEWHLSKDEILQLYLNKVPYGSNIEGIKAASIIYYDRLPHQMSLSQIVALTLIPNRPNSYTIGRHNERIRTERDIWLKRFAKEGVFDSLRVNNAIREPFEYKRNIMHRKAPHLSLRLRRTFRDTYTIRSSIDGEVQSRVESLVYAANQRLRSRNIRQAAVIVIDNNTRQVKAYVGSPDFFDDREAGQVDGVRAVRSPGSTLKPLIYAIAIDKGLMTPKSLINDVPIQIDGYSPENFDTKYNGAVTMEDALAYSLNIPAVKTLNQIGVPALVDKLIEADFRQIALDRNKLGLSVALGGCGTRLEELASLYSTFANNGSYSRLHWLASDTLSSQIQLISESSAYLITESMTRLIRPDLPNNAASSLRIPKIAWKTGTSYGRRDAWSIGYNQRYTIAVWVGNSNNEGAAELSGADIATPILFDLFNTLDYNSTNRWYNPTPDLSYRFVCPESGLPPGEFCEHSIVDWHIPGVSQTHACQHLREVFVSPDESISYCTSCRPNVGYKRNTYPDYAPDLIAWMDRVGISYSKIPPHNPACTRVFRQNPPRIVSPVANQEYLLDTTDKPQLMLSAEVASDVTMVYWYLNDRFIASSQAGESVFIDVEPGNAKISCTDDRGRNTDITVKVTYF